MADLLEIDYNTNRDKDDLKSIHTANQEERIRKWIHRLEGKYRIKKESFNPKCAVEKKMRQFKQFTEDMLKALKERDPVAMTAVHRWDLEVIYLTLPDLRKFGDVHNLVKEAIKKHPYSRTCAQRAFLFIADADGTLQQRIAHIIAEQDRWHAEALKMPDLLFDPNHAVVLCEGLTKVRIDDPKKPGPGDVCPVCTEQFAPQAEWNGHGDNAPVLASCGHIFCRGCLRLWGESIQDAGGTFRCPLCRKCFACGEAVEDCRYHRIDIDLRMRVPLDWVLKSVRSRDLCFTKNTDFSISRRALRKLREKTREQRGRIYYLECFLETSSQNTEDAVYQYHLRESKKVWLEIRRWLRLTEKGPVVPDDSTTHMNFHDPWRSTYIEPSSRPHVGPQRSRSV
ncbi:hypothetical protein BDV96DRAFT_595905 [Lophiotrema nucula]|uniref:Uncharacterized protein n=1 Tax=Lophiotrema nucula TaxID=690887 RepID=A0A6A5ZQ15_9PLEO|nr:hypothetical protein BDV96DRAFT_595905 [Lophiotrema nucula]